MSSPVVPGVITSVCVDGGDAAELEGKVVSALALASESGLYVVDCTLSGVGVGPRWMAQLTFTDTSYPGGSPTGFTTGICVQGGDPAEVDAQVQAVLSAPLRSYVAVEMAGAGAGRDYMALVLQQIQLAQ
jgi:hypothetical protein